MIITLKHGTSEEQKRGLVEWLETQVRTVSVFDGDYQTVLGLIGNEVNVDKELV